MTTGRALMIAAVATMCMMLAAANLRQFQIRPSRMALMALAWVVIFAAVMAVGVMLKR